jgi:hypothetical protein
MEKVVSVEPAKVSFGKLIGRLDKGLVFILLILLFGMLENFLSLHYITVAS